MTPLLSPHHPLSQSICQSVCRYPQLRQNKHCLLVLGKLLLLLVLLRCRQYVTQSMAGCRLRTLSPPTSIKCSALPTSAGRRCRLVGSATPTHRPSDTLRRTMSASQSRHQSATSAISQRISLDARL